MDRRSIIRVLSLVAVLAGMTALVSLLDRMDSGSSAGKRKAPVIDLLSGENAILSSDHVTVSVGETFALSVDYYEGDILWGSYDTSVVRISRTGILEGVSSGESAVFAECGVYTLAAGVTVQEP